MKLPLLSKQLLQHETLIRHLAIPSNLSTPSPSQNHKNHSSAMAESIEVTWVICMSWNMTALCTCHNCLHNKGNFVWHHTSLDPDSLSRKLKSQSEVVFCLANGLCGLFCALVISDSAPHKIFLEKESGWRDYFWAKPFYRSKLM